jgi:ribose transport system permease protein
VFSLNRNSFGRFQSLLALLLLIVALSLASDSFLTVDNGLNVLRQISINLCLSIGMTLVILSGGIDLSVGSVLALSGAVAAGLLKNGLSLAPINGLITRWLGTSFAWLDVALQFTVFGAIVAGIAVGLAAGWCNGYVITRFRLPPFVATLGMLSVARGLTQLWTGNFPITNLGDEFRFIGTGYFFGVPMPVWICAALVLVFVVVTRRTRFGRHLYAVGGNERAALLSGLDVTGVKRMVYMLAGGLAGVAGLLLTARLDAADPKFGIGYELDSIAAVVIGGTSLSGGRGSVLGTVLGCLIIGVLNNGLVLLGVSPDWQLVVKGVVILVAVAIDQAGRKSD